MTTSSVKKFRSSWLCRGLQARTRRATSSLVIQKKAVLDPPVWPKTPEPKPPTAPMTPIREPTCHLDVTHMSLCCLPLSGILSTESDTPAFCEKSLKNEANRFLADTNLHSHVPSVAERDT